MLSDIETQTLNQCLERINLKYPCMPKAKHLSWKSDLSTSRKKKGRAPHADASNMRPVFDQSSYTVPKTNIESSPSGDGDRDIVQQLLLARADVENATVYGDLVSGWGFEFRV